LRNKVSTEGLGFDLILQAFSGLMSVTGEVGGKPLKTGNSVADMNAGIVAKPNGTAHPLIAPYETFSCSDGDIAIGGANQSNWERIAKMLGHEEWMADPRFIDGATRLANRQELADLMTLQLREKTVAQWLAELDAAGVPAGPVNNVAQALENEQTKAVSMVIDVDHPNGKKGRAIGSPLHINGKSLAKTDAPPKVGQHTAAVLKEFGFAPDEIAGLLRDAIVFQG
jgi:crotonobetainyl-CoA:carnitine CoA-transferase CaiB-like acyl-CoA transferase